MIWRDPSDCRVEHPPAQSGERLRVGAHGEGRAVLAAGHRHVVGLAVAVVDSGLGDGVVTGNAKRTQQKCK